MSILRKLMKGDTSIVSLVHRFFGTPATITFYQRTSLPGDDEEKEIIETINLLIIPETIESQSNSAGAETIRKDHLFSGFVPYESLKRLPQIDLDTITIEERIYRIFKIEQIVVCGKILSLRIKGTIE